jgi:hypothetical protein
MANLLQGGQPTSAPKKKGVLDVQHQRRRMKTYTVTELELDTMSTIRGGCAFSIAMATWLIGTAIGIWISRAFADPKTLTAEAKVLNGPCASIIFWVGMAFAVFATISYFRAGGMVKTIKRESEEDVST